MPKRTIKIPIKVRTQTRVQTQVRRTGSSSSHARIIGWAGPAPTQTVNNYGDTNTINGDGNTMAVDVTGDLVQIAGQPRVSDPAELARLVHDLLAVLPTMHLHADARDQLREDAEAALAETASVEPDQGRMRQLGQAIAHALGTVTVGATGGTIAQAFGPAILAAVGG